MRLSMRRQATGHARQLARSRKRRSAAPDRESQPERDANGEGAKAGDSRRRASALLLLAFAVVFIGLRVGSLTHKSATFDEPIHLTAGYLAAAAGDYRVDPSHPPFVRIWAALPLLVMSGVRADTSQIDRLSDEAWLQDAYRFSSHFLYREHDADRLLQPARFMMVLWGVGLGILLFFWAHEWLGFTPAAIALAFYTIEPNIAAHARAQNVTVSLEQLDGHCTMFVTDDGCGFDTTAPSRRSGLGLVSLSERVHMLGGDFVVTATPQAGTRIAVSLPTGELHAS